MPQELPYLPSYKNVALLFEKIRSAKVPEAFTQKYLNETLGLKSSGDRALITLLKTLGFIDNAGKPHPRYNALKNEKIAGIEIARGVKEAYAALFSANEKANELNRQELKGLVAQVAGTDTGTTGKIVGTFRALVAVADFTSDDMLREDEVEHVPKSDAESRNQCPPPPGSMQFQGMRPEFHYNIQIHLPSNGSEETYMNIFNAMRKVFK